MNLTPHSLDHERTMLIMEGNQPHETGARMKYSIKIRYSKTGDEYYLQTGQGQTPNRTILSTNFSWVRLALRTTYVDFDQAMKWLVFLNKIMAENISEITLLLEKA